MEESLWIKQVYSPGHREWDASIGSVPDVWKQYEEALHPGASL